MVRECSLSSLRYSVRGNSMENAHLTGSSTKQCSRAVGVSSQGTITDPHLFPSYRDCTDLSSIWCQQPRARLSPYWQRRASSASASHICQAFRLIGRNMYWRRHRPHRQSSMQQLSVISDLGVRFSRTLSRLHLVSGLMQ